MKIFFVFELISIKLFRELILLAGFIILSILGKAQEIPVNPLLLNKKWEAQWITCPGVIQKAYGVYHFRKKVRMDSKPSKFIIHVSADNRYRLFVNGMPVCFGPAQGDLYNWYFETVDLASYLTTGDNVIAATVWNMGEFAPVSQVTNQTAFVLQGDGISESVLNTNNSWRVIKDSAYNPCSMETGTVLKEYYALGPGDHCNASRYPNGWEKISYSENGWLSAERISQAVPLGYGTDNKWTLVPRGIPLMEQSSQRFASIRRFSGIDKVSSFITGKAPLNIPPGKKVSILLDQSHNTLAYPELIVSKGKGSLIKISYAEALFRNGKKGNRNDIEGRELIGNYDLFEPDGSSKSLFRPLWQRSFRYVQLDITTGTEPLILEDLYGIYTGYPFKENAVFTSNDASLQEIWKTGWRTARLCANELYYDCPYYEQLQYVGDTRIQSLISLYVSGDDRLMRKAINDFYNSRVPEGLTQGRFPSSRIQVIPPFSLYWVSMLYDYMMHRKDDAFLGKYLDAAAGILNWYERHVDKTKSMLGPMKWWNFTDWTAPFVNMGVPPGATDGNSAVLTLQYAYTLQLAAELFDHYGRGGEAANYRLMAERLNKASIALCYDAKRGLLGDTPEKKSFSQHTNIMSVLSGAVDSAQRKAVLGKVLQDPALAQASFYYRFYLVQALKKSDLADLYYGQLTPWREMLKSGLTTFAETPDPSRSDCHAWSASPNYDFLATICGITPIAPGFAKVQVKPALGELNYVSGKMPSPAGDISVEVDMRSGKNVAVNIKLPAGLSGIFVWKGERRELLSGENVFRF
ncbi:MAG: alpha-rhamnosidase [Chitinophagaceae bacterium]|nr:alpha-rhamnosidase [Chitinophagaceae bacterium]